MKASDCTFSSVYPLVRQHQQSRVHNESTAASYSCCTDQLSVSSMGIRRMARPIRVRSMGPRWMGLRSWSMGFRWSWSVGLARILWLWQTIDQKKLHASVSLVMCCMVFLLGHY
ncbi:hypothetical protein GCK32_011622 [Trichostrongylus colubriformis]|uniref:Uncharacterized protein n=1 Tax=Trichostrongylus colubriformis TaxID=6319 RepID=A0AAN8IDF5_TRICO